MPHGYRQSNARLVWLMCPYLSANYVADCPPNMAQVSVYKDERPGKRQSPWSISNQAFFRLPKKSQKISTHLLARLGWFCPVVSEPVKPYFTRFLRVLTFCLGASKIVIF